MPREQRDTRARQQQAGVSELRVGTFGETGERVRDGRRLFRRIRTAVWLRVLLQPARWHVSPVLRAGFVQDPPSPAFPDPAECLKPTAFLDSDHPSIRACVERLIAPDATPRETAVRVFEFVRDSIQYEFFAKLTREEYVASYILEKGRGFCIQKGVLLCTLARAAGVPAALVFHDLRDHSFSPKVRQAVGGNVMSYHGIAAFHLDGRWLQADAALSPDVITRKGYRPVVFDGTSDALLAPTTLAGEPHAEYINFHGGFADLPMDMIMQALETQMREMNLEAMAELATRF